MYAMKHQKSLPPSTSVTASLCKRMAATLALGLNTFFGAQAQDLNLYPWLDRSLSFHERAVLLVKNMTLEEKVSQLGNKVGSPIVRNGITVVPPYQYWNEAIHGVIDDGPSTSFPCLKAMSSTWDTDLVRRCAEAISDEARAHHLQTGKGLDYWCPTINMSRDPRWGRDEENYGEDTYLAGRLAVNFLAGLQGQPDENGYYKLVGCAKHFAANNYEVGRHSTTSFVTEKNMREYYLPVFEQSVKEGQVRSIMAAYNALSTDITETNAAGAGYKQAKGGMPCSANKMLLTDILRKEWGFKGYVVSDCAAVSDVYRNTKHLFWGSWSTGSHADSLRMEALSASLCLKAGLDNNCEFKNTTSVLQRAGAYAISDAFKQNETTFAKYATLTEADIDTAVVRLMESRFALGEFDEPYITISWNNNKYDIEGPAKQTLALEAAQKAITLLKNEAPEGASAPLLPLTPDKKIALVGSFVNKINTGGYSGNAGPTYYSTPYTAFAQAMNYTLNDGTVQFEDYSSFSSSSPEDKFKNASGYIENTAPGNVVVYDQIDFGKGCSNFSMRVAAKSSGLATANFYLDDAKEPSLSVGNLDTGGWTKWSTVETTCNPNIFQGVHQVKVVFTGAQKYAGNWDWFRFHNKGQEPLETAGPLYVLQTTTSNVGETVSQEMIDRAVAVAQRADVVLFCGGLQNYSGANDTQSGRESVDRTQLTLPGNQQEVLKAMLAVNKNIVLCFYGGSSMDFTWEKNNLPAILCCWYNGQAQGQALCDVIYGKVNPSGKLTSTWYNCWDELPQANASELGRGGMLEYNIDRWGYTYMYYGKGDKNPNQAAKPLFPFGFGLSYTHFTYNDMALSANTIDKGKQVVVTANITNTGSHSGTEIVQLYANFNGDYHYGYNGNMRHKLVGFARVKLAPGETKRVEIPIDYESLSYYNESAHNYQVPDAKVTLELAASSEDIRLTKELLTTSGIAKETYLSDGTTFIEPITTSKTLSKNDHIYNVMGAYLCPASDYNQLPAGIYVINGMKYIKKNK